MAQNDLNQEIDNLYGVSQNQPSQLPQPQQAPPQDQDDTSNLPNYDDLQSESGYIPEPGQDIPDQGQTLPTSPQNVQPGATNQLQSNQNQDDTSNLPNYDDLQKENGYIPEPGQDIPDQTSQQSQTSQTSQTSQPSQQPSGAWSTYKAWEAGLERGATFGLSDWRDAKVQVAQTIANTLGHIINPKANLSGWGESVVPTDAQQIQLEQEHPTASSIGQLAGSALPAIFATAALPVGEASAALAKIGSAALSGAVQGSMFNLGDETSKMMLGTADPNESVAHALLAAGASGALIGGATGGALGSFGIGATKGLRWLADTSLGQAADQGLQDFANRWNFRLQNPDLVHAVGNELQNFHDTTTDLKSHVWGENGFKQQAIQKLTQDISPQNMAAHVQQVQSMIDDAPQAVKTSTAFQDAVSNWQQKVIPETNFNNQMIGVLPQPKDPASIFQATDLLKRQLSEYGNPAKLTNPLVHIPIDEQPQIFGFGKMAGKISSTLENSDVWGDAGNLQKDLNSATSNFIPAQSDFIKKFTSPQLGERVIDPGKINMYVNQLGKPNAEIKQSIVDNYLNSGNNYRNTISNIYNKFGFESPVVPASTDAIKGTLGQAMSGGAKWADRIFSMHTGLAARLGERFAGEEIGGALFGTPGRVAGYMMGAGAPEVTEMLHKPLTEKVVPAVIKALSMGRPYAVAAGIEHANNLLQGSSIMGTGVNSLFDSMAPQIPAADNNKIQKIKKYVESGQYDKELEAYNKQLQQEANPQTPQAPQAPQNHVALPPQRYAEGGMIAQRPVPTNIVKQHTYKSIGHLRDVYPEQDTIVSTARSRVYNHLRSQMPMPSMTMPFDNPHTSVEQQRHYDKALTIAASPESIFNSIRKGTLTPQELAHFQAMWPEIHTSMSNNITQKMMEQKAANKPMPSFKTRQAISMFMGQPLEANLTPQNIMAAQATFSPSSSSTQSLQPSQPSQSKNKKPSQKAAQSMEKTNNLYQTPSQSAAKDASQRS